MKAEHKMAAVGSGLVAAGIGLSIVGAALIVPAVFASAARLLDSSAERLGGELENASRKAGAFAGNLHRSFNEARRAGVAELKRGAKESTAN